MKMATGRPQIFTDEQILAELGNLGYESVTEGQFQLIKEDLENLVEAQLREGSSSPSSLGSSVLSNSSSTHSAISITPDPEVEKRHRSRFQDAVNDTSLNSPIRRRLASSSCSLGGDVPSNKENQSLNADPQIVQQRMIKRKVLRYVDGRKVLVEEVRPMPNFKGMTLNNWNSNSLRTKSSSTDELWQRLSSVSLSSKSSNSSERNRTSSRQSGVMLPNMNVKRKKCDPVTRYHEYRKYWDTFKLPGENKHNQLRWTVREKMLDYDFS